MLFGNSPSFIEYFNSVKGRDIEIDNKNKFAIISTKNGERVSVMFSKDITWRITVADLLRTNHEEGEKVYYVFPNGAKGQDWLYPLEQGMTL